jgi:predicted ArsR family transcriptional regulator
VGTVNWHLRRLIAKGYIKAKRAERKKLRYILTPEGISLRARLTVQYVERSMALYRQAREDARKVLARAREQGYRAAYVVGDGDIADVCRLTCLEQGMPIVDSQGASHVARIEVRGHEIVLGEGRTA